MILIILLIITAVSLIAAILFGYRLYRWEVLLSRARVKVYFKNRVAMTPRLIDILTWCNELQKDKALNGQVIYKQGGTTIALVKAHKRVPKPKDKVIKEKKGWRQKRADLRHGSQQPKEGRLKARLGSKIPQ